MTEEQKPSSEVMTELEALGKQLGAAVKALWQSEESRRLRQEIGDGFVQLGQHLDEAVKAAQDSEAAKEFKEQVKGTVDRARESDVAGKVQQGLVTGLHQLNTELSKLVGSLESSRKPESGTPGESAPPPEGDTAA
jgi:uncharacterized coiled-coil DUF342 family protein